MRLDPFDSSVNTEPELQLFKYRKEKNESKRKLKTTCPHKRFFMDLALRRFAHLRPSQIKTFLSFQFCDDNNTLEAYCCHYNVICLSRQMQENMSLMIFFLIIAEYMLYFFILQFLGKVTSILHSFFNTSQL